MKILQKRNSKVLTVFSLAVFLMVASPMLMSGAKAQNSSASQEEKIEVRSLEDLEKLKQEIRDNPNISPEEKEKFFSEQEKIMTDSKMITAKPANYANCFDYYKFQSVQVSAASAKENYSSGDQIIFTGTLKNENPYPVFDGYLFVRIGRDNPNYITQGQFAVDEFFALEKVALNENEQSPISFSWKAPANLAKGEYHADFFFSVGKKFNLGGLPFFNEIVSSSTRFNIDSKNNNPVYLTRSDTKINGEKYNHIGKTPVVEPGAQVVITQPLSNSSSSEKKVKVTYDLYWWDSLNEKDKIASSSEEITVPGKGTKQLSYTIPEMKDAVYYLRISSDSGGEKSIVNIRMASEQVHPRLNFPALNKFPIPKGEKATMFACFHNTSNTNMKGKVTMALYDRDGKKVDQMEYNDVINGLMLADKKDFVASKNLDWLRLEATLQDEGGKIIDSYSAVYDCALLGNGKCLNKSSGQETKAIPFSEDKTKGGKIILPLAILAVILAALGIFLWVRRKERNDDGKSDNKSIGFLLLLIILTSAMLYAYHGRESSGQSSGIPPADPAFKKQTVKSKTPDTAPVTFSWKYISIHMVRFTAVGYRYTCGGSMQVSADYEMEISNNNVKVGDDINFSFNVPEQPYYFGGGSCNFASTDVPGAPLPTEPVIYYDSPYGAWCPDLSTRCGGEELDTGLYMKWVPTLTKPSGFQVSSSDSSVVSCSGMNCTAQSPGEVVLTARIPEAQGKQWLTPLPIPNGTVTVYSGDPYVLPSAEVQWTVNVTAPSPIPGQCASPPNGREYCPPYPDIASMKLCDATGSVPSVIENSGGWNWKCTGQNGGITPPDCQAYKSTSTVVPKCGTPNFCEEDSPPLCASGNPVGVYPSANTYEVAWQCEGACLPADQIQIECSARGKKACGWIETNP